MWQSPYAKKKPTATAKRRGGLKLTLRRVTAEIKLLKSNRLSSGLQSGDQEEIILGKVILNDFKSRGISIYTSEAIVVGQEVSITIEEPTQFFCKGQVIWSQLEDARVISENPLKYRMGIEFHFESESEENAVRDYCEQLNREHLFRRKAA